MASVRAYKANPGDESDEISISVGTDEEEGMVTLNIDGQEVMLDPEAAEDLAEILMAEADNVEEVEEEM